MLRNDKLLITFVCSIVCAAFFTLSFINIAYCINDYDNVTTFTCTYTQYGAYDFRIESSEPVFTCLSTSGSYYGYSGYSICEDNFNENFYFKTADIDEWGSVGGASSYQSFTYHGLTYDYYVFKLNMLSPASDMRCTSGDGATVSFNSINLTDGLSMSDYIYLVWKGIIDDDNFNYPEGY